MDFLSKKREYTFLNNHNALTHVHTFQVTHTPYKIYSEGKSKKYRDSVNLLEDVLSSFHTENLPTFVIVNNIKLGEGSISSYNAKQDVIYFNSKYAKQRLQANIINEVIAEVLTRNDSPDEQLKKIIKEELNYGRFDDGHSSSPNRR